MRHALRVKKRRGHRSLYCTVRRFRPTPALRSAESRTRQLAGLKTPIDCLARVQFGREHATAKGNRYGHRDATMILLAFRHGLRAVELVDLEWSQVDFKTSVLHVRRAKKGTPATHPLPAWSATLAKRFHAAEFRYCRSQ
jgi:integrase